MIHIAKSDTGFIVANLADNGEVLSASEVLSSKQKCWVNIYSQHEQWASGWVYAQDDTVNVSVVYRVFVSKGKGDKKRLKIKPKAKYIPSTTKPKYQPKKK